MRDERRSSNVIAQARIQGVCEMYNLNVGCFDGSRTNPRNNTVKNIALYIRKNQLCLLRKSQDVSFGENFTIDELNLNFKIVDICLSDKHIKKFIKYEYKPKKVKSPLTIFINVYDLEMSENH